ncbi:MAG TPA: hypothetical protein VG147_09025 [Solirubrobacteraceae bacterium]|nr:hypothetical protein [Solirubrobacteraceae bacterium]
MKNMKHIRIIGLALVAVFALCAFAATSALAMPSATFSVAGKKLETGEAKEIKATDSEEFTLKGKGALEAEAVTKCKKLKLDAADKPEIVGGTPGTSKNESIEFEECTGVIKSLFGEAKCTSVEITSPETNNELVLVVAPAELKEKLATLFTPASGKVFSKIKLNKCGALGNQTAEVEGTTAALVPSEAEALEGKLVWSEKSIITEIEKTNGTKEKVGLTSDKKTATLNGAASVSLVSGQDWSAL